MARTKSWVKNIACLETSLWDEKRDFDVATRLSVKQLLELTARGTGAKFSHFTCSTQREFEFDLRALKRKRGYGILYLAFHGLPAGIAFRDHSEIELEALAEIMGRSFADWVVHFGSCETLKRKSVRDSRALNFVQNTGVSMLLGYEKSIPWLESAALDLLLFSELERYKDMRYFWRGFQKRYGQLIRRVGLVAVPS